LLLSSPLMNGEDFSLIDKDVGDVARKLSMIWNVYDFFTMYADVDNWEWNGESSDPSKDVENILDTWILSKIHTLINDVEKATKEYDLQSATRYIMPFLDELSNWYVRRSRKRFWKSDDDADKQNAYKTLHYVMVQYAHVLAPFAPFMADELYQKMTGDDSVHLRDWPRAGTINDTVMEEMDSVRKAVNEGLSFRSKAQLKVRQPLASVKVQGGQDLGVRAQVYTDVLKEELNVKTVQWSTEGEFSVELDTNITEELKAEGIAREVVRIVQQARKDAGLEVDDRIALSLVCEDNEVHEAILSHKEYISAETLATELETSEKQYAYMVDKKLNKIPFTVSLEKQG
jgi:isoleucyl-tRNA synthetase